ncbi:MAG: esterase/lipase [Glaciecola sp.]|jgi:esterase/lipase
MAEPISFEVSNGLPLIKIKPQLSYFVSSILVLLTIFVLLGSLPSIAQESAGSSVDTQQVIEIAVELNSLGLPIEMFNGFSALYEKELGSVKLCDEHIAFNEYKVCSKALKNEGNSPFILYSKGQLPTQTKVSPQIEPNPEAGVLVKNNSTQSLKRASAPIVVLFHGLSDSPFFVRGIAEHLNSRGFTVVAPLTPGHGKLDAVADMKDPNLQARWYEHVDKIMALVEPYSDTTFIGGFSTGGTLATRYMILQPDEIDGLLLFSGALALSGNAENLGRIWGMKWLAKIVDGDFVSAGPNRYRYPDVAGYAGLTLADAIFEVRDLLEEKTVSKPIFAAHSLADITTPFYGVEDLMNAVKGDHQTFTIAPSYDTCHQDLVVSAVMMIDLKVDKTQLNISERCAVPKPNPLFRNMMAMLDYYFAQRLPAQ